MPRTKRSSSRRQSKPRRQRRSKRLSKRRSKNYDRTTYIIERPYEDMAYSPMEMPYSDWNDSWAYSPAGEALTGVLANLKSTLLSATNTQAGKDLLWQATIAVQPELEALNSIPPLKDLLINFEIHYGSTQADKVIAAINNLDKQLGPTFDNLYAAYKATQDKSQSRWVTVPKLAAAAAAAAPALMAAASKVLN